MKNLYLIFLFSLISLSAQANETNWTGFYVGGNLGYAKADSDSKVSLGALWSGESQALQDFFRNNSQDKQNLSGTGFGFQAGYDYQLANKIILGLEVDYTKLDLDDSRQTPLLDGPIDFAFSNKVELNHSYSLRPKLGYAFDKTQLYVTAGYVWTSAEFSSDVISEFGYSKGGKKSKTLTSAIWGVGIEHKFFDNVSAKLEYLKINGDNASYTTIDRPGNVFPGYTERFKVDLDYDMIRAGINYRF